jgi:hypothetical protein
MQQPLALNTTTAFPLAIRATRSYTAIAASDGAGDADSATAAATPPLPDSATSIRSIFVGLLGWLVSIDRSPLLFCGECVRVVVVVDCFGFFGTAGCGAIEARRLEERGWACAFIGQGAAAGLVCWMKATTPAQRIGRRRGMLAGVVARDTSTTTPTSYY